MVKKFVTVRISEDNRARVKAYIQRHEPGTSINKFLEDLMPWLESQETKEVMQDVREETQINPKRERDGEGEIPGSFESWSLS